MPKIAEITFAGRQVKLASPPFTEEVCELIELVEKAGEHNIKNEKLSKEDRKPFKQNARLMRLLWIVARDCLVRAGNTEKQAKEFLASVSLDDDLEDGIPALAAAIGVV